MKKIFIASLFTLFLTTSAFAMSISLNFADEDSFAAWFAPSVKKMALNGIMTGYPDGTFRPMNPVSRGELAVILDRYSSKKEITNEPLVCTTQMNVGLKLIVRDNYGKPLQNVKITVLENSSPEAKFIETPDGFYEGLYEGKGYYTVKVEKEGYSDYTETVKLEHDACHVITQTKTITLFPLL